MNQNVNFSPLSTTNTNKRNNKKIGQGQMSQETYGFFYSLCKLSSLKSENNFVVVY